MSILNLLVMLTLFISSGAGVLEGRSCDDKSKSAVREVSQTSTLKIGIWGGDHVSMEVTPSGAVLEFDCAHGNIDQRIILDAHGGFDAAGTYTREHGGPIRTGHEPAARPARYGGKVDNDTIALTNKEGDGKEVIDTLSLTLGADPRVTKCR